MSTQPTTEPRHAALSVESPIDEGEVSLLLRAAARDNRRVAPIGLGSELPYLRPEIGATRTRTSGTEVDSLITTRKLNQVVAYEPGDGTLTAQAGCTMQTLADAVAAGGHRLTPDLPRAGERSLGGVLAGGLSGPDRLRFGPLRHHVLGMRVAMADGTIAKSGGRLVKNVTGFDLHRLYCGSRGTLAVILEASLRLFPEPEAERVLVATLDDTASALKAAGGLRHLPLRPLAILVDATDLASAPRLAVVLAGRTRQVEVDAATLRGRLPIDEDHQASDAGRERGRLFDRCGLGSDPSSLFVLCPPSRTVDTFDLLRARLSPLGFEGRIFVQPGVARFDVWIDTPKVSPPELANLLRALARDSSAQGARLGARSLPPSVHAALAARSSELPGSAWMEGLQKALDPAAVLASPWFPTRR